MTTCYTFKVTMEVQVLSEDDAETARAALDQQGGYVAEREVELIATTIIGQDKSFKVIDGDKQ